MSDVSLCEACGAYVCTLFVCTHCNKRVCEACYVFGKCINCM